MDVEQPLTCGTCGKAFTRKDNLYKHMRSVHDVKPELNKGDFACSECDDHFVRQYDLYRHMRSVHDVEPELNNGDFACNECAEHFVHQYNLYRHMKEAHGKDVVSEARNERKDRRKDPVRPFNFTKDISNSMFMCRTCNQPFQSKTKRDYHARIHKQQKKFMCKICFKMFTKIQSKKMHERNCPVPTTSIVQTGAGTTSNREEDIVDGEFELRETALRNVVKSERMHFDASGLNLLDRLQLALRHAHDVIIEEQESNEQRKVYLSLQSCFYKASNPDVVSDPIPTFNTEAVAILPGTDVQDVVEKFYVSLLKAIDNYEKTGSGWILNYLVSLDVNLLRYNPLRASSFIEMPKKFKDKKGYINIMNEDQKCFVWSILAHLHPVDDHNNRVSNYTKFESELNMKGIDFPVRINDIGKFEGNNPTISVSVFGLSDNQAVFPVRVAAEVKEHHIHLLYISNGKTNHYVLIKSLSSLVFNQISKNCNKKWICENCIYPFSSKRVRDDHFEICKGFQPVRSVYPKPGKHILEFTKYEHQLPAPFFVVADFETLQKPIETVHANPTISSTTAYAKHLPCSAAYFIVSIDGKFFEKAKMFRGERCVRQFLDSLKKDVDKLTEVIKHPMAMIMTDADEDNFKHATTCFICKTDCDPDDKLVRDHCHLTGAYRGAAHSSCNLNYRIKPDRYKVPVFFHNLRGYDAHFIMQEVVESKHGKIKCIPKTGEQYISLTVGNMVFKDSLAFTYKSLDHLVETLQDEQLNYTRQLVNEGVLSCPFEFVDSAIEDVTTSRKRKRKTQNKSQKLARNDFLDDDVEVSTDDREGDDDDCESAHESDDDFIDDDDNIDDGDQSFYHQCDNADVINKPGKQRLYTIDDLPNGDYRKTSHFSCELTEDQKRLADERFQLVKRKGVYPYEYFDDFKKFEETTLPKSKDAFYSSLTGETITDEDHAHAFKVFSKFGMKSLLDYHNLYLLTDIFLLADVMVSFRKMCLDYYKIDPMHSFTAPGFAWQAALRMTKVKLDLLTDANMYEFCERIHGGISVITHRHAEADENNSLLYIDANNLYGWAMSQPLPTSNFGWMPEECLDSFDVLSVADDSPKGFILEVDLEYPTELHDLHNEYPLAAESMTVTDGMLSCEQLSILEKLERQHLINSGKNFIGPIKPSSSTTKKLIPNLYDKSNYTVHYRNLKLYLNLGMKLRKVHRVLVFDQKPWLKVYIDFNTMKRAEATSEFAKDFFKLLNNVVFGKTMQNVRKERRIDFVSSERKAEKLIAQPTFKNYTKYREDLIAIERKKATIFFNKPIYAGFSILDLSKTLMYDFHYQFIKKKYPDEQSKLCFTDTDSFLYRIKTKDIHRDMLENVELFDFSEYPDNHSCFSNLSIDEIKSVKGKNKKVIGKFKDEMKGKHMLEFVGLRAKMYSFRSSEKETKKLKGVKTSVVKREIHFNHYKNCLFNKERHHATMNVFRVKCHKVESVRQNKISLSCYDDKRYLLADNISSLAYGHYKLNGTF